MAVAAVAGDCAVVAESLSVLTSAQFAAVVGGVQDDGAECDVVGEQVARIELGLFQLHFVVALVLAVAAVGGHLGEDGSSQT